MLSCKKSIYDSSQESQYIKRFNIIQDIVSLHKFVDNLSSPNDTTYTYKYTNNFTKTWNKNVVRNTLLYMFHNSTSSMFVTIRNKVPVVYLIFNTKLNNVKLNKIRFPCQIPPWIRVKATGCLISFEVIPNKTETPQSFYCKGKEIIDKEWYKSANYTPVFYYDEYSRFLEYLCKHREIPDMDFIINHKDQVIVPNDLQVSQMLPIYSNCTADDCQDIPIVTPDELIQVFNIHSISRNCENPFKGLKTPAWKDRKATAIFRGSATGCGNDTKTNMRLSLSSLDAQWSSNNMYNNKNKIDETKYLDAGIVSWGTRRMKIIRGTNRADYPNIPYLSKQQGIKLKKFMTMQEQRQYKYVLYVEGNVLAYRLGYLFSTKSVVFYIKSKYKPWFYDKLQHKVNCIMIESDLSNLAEYITWCKLNDKDAYNIAKNGYKLYKELIGNKSYVLDYMKNMLPQ